MSYFAHYDAEKNIRQLLRDHLEAVAKLAEAQVPPNVQFDYIDNLAIKEIVRALGCYHDLGKYTQYFQDYLLQGKNSHLKNHAHISACFTYAFLSEKLKHLPEGKQKRIVAFIAYLCIRLHHQSLSLEGLFPIRDIEMWDTLEKIAENLIANANEILKDSKNIFTSITPQQFKKYLQIDSLKKDKRNFIYMPEYFTSGRADDARWYFLVIYLFSLLIDCDKLDSGGVKSVHVKNISPDYVSKYLARKPVSKTNQSLVARREKARRTILNVIENLDDTAIKEYRFFTLTAPTGIGKTLASLQCALRLQERIKEVEGYLPRIIVAIPFINIIEQTKTEYLNVASDELRLVVHHRLGDFTAYRDAGEEVPLDKSLLEVESWEGDIILTTFVQFFQSIFTNKNRALKKINKLAGSIVILDEVQAVPEKYMPLIGAAMQKISVYWGTRFILMTATQPKILEFGNLLLNDPALHKPAIPLLPDYPSYFKELKRTKFIPLLNARMDTEQFISLFEQKWNGLTSALIVVNTIKRSIDI